MAGHSPRLRLLSHTLTRRGSLTHTIRLEIESIGVHRLPEFTATDRIIGAMHIIPPQQNLVQQHVRGREYFFVDMFLSFAAS